MIPDQKFVTNPTLQKMTHSIIPNLGPEIFDNTLFIIILFFKLYKDTVPIIKPPLPSEYIEPPIGECIRGAG